MLFIVGINAAVIVAAVIASMLFAQLAEEKGYQTSKARKYPLMIGGFTLIIMMGGQTLVSFMANMMQARPGGIADALIYVGSGFLFIVSLTILYKAYQNMKLAPNAGVKHSEPKNKS